MDRYIVKFVDDMLSMGPSEVEYAEVLPGWVMVKWRNLRNVVRYYPAHLVQYVETPEPEMDVIEAPEELSVEDEMSVEES